MIGSSAWEHLLVRSLILQALYRSVTIATALVCCSPAARSDGISSKMGSPHPNVRAHPYQGSAPRLVSAGSHLRPARTMYRWRPLRTARCRWRVDQTWTKAPCSGLVDHPLGSGRVQQLAAEVLEQAQDLGVIVRPRHPRLARSRTAKTRLRQEASPGSRPITLVRRRVSPRSARLTGHGGWVKPAGQESGLMSRRPRCCWSRSMTRL
jgi:hypothetical protein